MHVQEESFFLKPESIIAISKSAAEITAADFCCRVCANKRFWNLCLQDREEDVKICLITERITDGVHSMKKKDKILAGSICILAAVLYLAAQFLLPHDHHKIRITVAGEVFGEYSLEEDREIIIGETNVCRILKGQASMTEATCPDKLCMHQKAVDAGGGSIVCLPNKVVIEAVSSDGTVVHPENLDGVA